MAGESIVQVTEGSGKKLHTYQRTVGANNVEDEIVLLGDQYLAAGSVSGNNTSIATANDHVMQLMASAGQALRVRRIRIQQAVLAGAAATGNFQIVRLTTAGTGGTAVTAAPYDPADTMTGAGMTLPTVKGTEVGTILIRGIYLALVAAAPMSTAFYEWVELPHMKPLVIPAGTANGIAIKSITAVAGASVSTLIEFTEQSFL